MSGPLPSPELIRKFLRYEPNTGKLVWLSRRLGEFKTLGSFKSWNSRYSGEEAFTAKNGQGYRHGTIMGVHYRAHRVVWVIAYGRWPENEIDHINGNRSDNRIENLREATRQENMRNQKVRSDNTSGKIGVIWCKRDGRWQAVIKALGRKIHLGNFKRKSAAIDARAAAEIKYGFHPNHGRQNTPAHSSPKG